MISSLHIKNLQSHKDTHLDFEKGVNIIVGPSDSGKSAILRALRWVAKNRPQGDILRSNWGGETEVSISLSEPGLEIEPEVTRIKGKSDEYILNGNSFKALRGDVPKEIQDILNITDINLQRQLDSPFLLSDAPGVVAAHFNKVANLDKIDTSTQYINGCIRELSGDIKRARIQITDCKNQLNQFEDLEQLEMEVQILEEMEKKLRGTKVTQDRLLDMIKEFNTIQNKIIQTSEILMYEEQINTLLSLYNKKSDLVDEQETLEEYIETLVDYKEQIDFITTLIEFEESIDLLLLLYNKLNKEQQGKERLSKVMESFNSVNVQLTKEESKHTQLLKEYNKNYPSVCPFCNTILKKS